MEDTDIFQQSVVESWEAGSSGSNLGSSVDGIAC